MYKRRELLEEEQLRDVVRKGIRIVLERRQRIRTRATLEEQKLRGIIRQLISETKTPDNDPAPHPSTGINVLEDLLKKIIPNLEMDFKKITSDPEQRKSYRAHIIQAVQHTLAPVKALDKAGEELRGTEELQEAEEIDIDVDETPEDPAFIDVGLKSDKKKEEPEDPRDSFRVQGLDRTGGNMAFETFKRIETNIIDAYDMLDSAEDKELFYDYLITNLKLYFDKFEGDMEASPEEPSTDEYEEASAETEEAPEETPEEELGAEEL